MNIANRIQKLEKTTGASERKPKMWVIIEGEPRPAGIKEGDMVIIVSSERVKELTERVGERLLMQGKSGGEIEEDG